MFTFQAEPQDILTTFRTSWQLFKAGFLKAFPIALVTALVLTIPLILYRPTYITGTEAYASGLIRRFGFVWLPSFLLSLVAYNIIYKILDDIVFENTTSYSQLFLLSLKKLPRIVPAALAYTVMVFFGLLLIIVPGLFAFFAFFFFYPMIVVDDCEIYEAFRDSLRLVMHSSGWRLVVFVLSMLVLLLIVAQVILFLGKDLVVIQAGHGQVIHLFVHVFDAILGAVFIIWTMSLILVHMRDLEIRVLVQMEAEGVGVIEEAVNK